MADKLKALVIGAYPRFVRKIDKKLSPFLDYELVMTEDTMDPRSVNGVNVVIILTDYVGRGIATAAREAARAKKIPVIDCVSENYVRTRLTEMKLLREEKKVEQPKEEETAPTTPNAPDTNIGLTHEQILQYIPHAKKAIEGIFGPGERHDESLFMPLLIDAIGLPEETVKEMIIPELIVSGIITNTVGTTWKRISGLSEAYAHGVDTVEAPKPREAVSKTFFKSMQGLHPGPYRSKYSISQEMEKYREFLKQDGTEASSTYLQKIVRMAEEEGIVEEKDGEYFINQDPSVTLTPIEKPKPPVEAKPPEPPKTEVKIGKMKIPTSFVPLTSIQTAAPTVKDEPVRKDFYEAKERPATFGHIDVLDVPIQLRTLKNMMPELFWDDMAFRSIEARLSAAGLKHTVVPKDSFLKEEWDALAWETLKKLPLANVVPVWMPDNFKDERLICADCGENFIFTKSDQEYFYRKFGDVKRPKACLTCRKARREGRGTSDDSGDHILSRYGG